MNITISKPISQPAVKAIAKTGGSKTDAVFAYTKSGGGFRRVRVSNFMPYGDAVEVFGRLEAFLRNQPSKSAADSPLGAGGGPVVYLAVRSKDDPNWNTSPRATAVRRDKAARRARSGARAI